MKSLYDFLAKAFDYVLIIQVISYKKRRLLFQQDESRRLLNDKNILNLIHMFSWFNGSSAAGQPKSCASSNQLEKWEAFFSNLPANYDIIPAAEGLNVFVFLAKHLTVECLSQICTI